MDRDAMTPERRHARRARVLLRGKVIVGDGIFDCTVLDLSDSGARVRFAVPVAVAEAFIFRLLDGASYPARRSWTRGNEMGIVFTGPALASGDIQQSRQADAALQALRAADPARCLAILAEERHFGDAALRRAAEALAAAHAALAAALKPHAVKAARAVGRDPG
jgi:hypothetical protein